MAESTLSPVALKDTLPSKPGHHAEVRRFGALSALVLTLSKPVPQERR
ncbi:hypothetical protein SynBIOSE41_02119 [Synechococcus sp. BIOS-E4-1]|nr:hypothetical protein SynBIOSE41_02119 [Synechococcus sp. BIOS-E4-1]